MARVTTSSMQYSYARGSILGVPGQAMCTMHGPTMGPVSITVGVLLLLTAAILVVLVARRSFATAALLRRSACALTLAVVLALTPRTFDAAGAAAGYMLGVPVLLALVILLSDMAGRGVRVVTAVGGVAMLVWSLVFHSTIGLALLPSALLLLGSAGWELRARREALRGVPRR